ncbi:MAG: hypothetical protein P4L16_01050 [Chlamydiales bacterium]|nr:hypothetical protein [Chlamydiales bacterium]
MRIAFSKKLEEKLPLWKAWLWIFCSIIFVLGCTWGTFLVLQYVHKMRIQDDRYTIVAILQTGPEKEVLNTSYLAELMGLSTDYKTNLIEFNEKKAAYALLTSPVIKQANVKKLIPGTVYVDYTVREPICTLYDYENVGMDQEGYIFPLRPFFSPKKLPEIYLGLLPFGMQEDEFGRVGGSWNAPLNTKEAQFSIKLVKEFSSPEFQEQFRLLRVDASSAYSELYGQRQVVFVIEDVLHRQEEKGVVTYVFPRILRLNTEEYLQDMQKYLLLREKLIDDALLSMKNHANETYVRGPALIIDLRIPELAYIKY